MKETTKNEGFETIFLINLIDILCRINLNLFVGTTTHFPLYKDNFICHWLYDDCV